MSKEEIKEKVQEIIDNNYSKFMGTNEAEIHSCFEIAELRKTGLEAIKIAEDLSYLKKKYETRVEESQAENTKLKASKSEANEADILHWTLHNYKPYEDGMNMVWRNINPDIDTLHTSKELTEIFKTRNNK